MLICNSNLLTSFHLAPHAKAISNNPHKFLEPEGILLIVYLAKPAQPRMCQTPRHWYWKSIRSWKPLTDTKFFIFQKSKLRLGKVKNLLGSQHHFQGLLIYRPVSELRLRAKSLDSDCTILALPQAALWNSTSISWETTVGVIKENKMVTLPRMASKPNQGNRHRC